jgi:hypothetical protein
VSFDAGWKDALIAHGVQPGPPLPVERLHHMDKEIGRPWPGVLRTLYAAADGLYDTPGQWWFVWPSTQVVSDNTRAWRNGELSIDLFAFGDDGTGNPFCIQNEDRVVYWSWISCEIEREVGNLDTFLAEWTGVDER